MPHVPTQLVTARQAHVWPATLSRANRDSGSNCDTCKRLMQKYTQSAKAIRMHMCIGTAGLKSTHTHMAACGLTGPYSGTVNATKLLEQA